MGGRTWIVKWAPEDSARTRRSTSISRPVPSAEPNRSLSLSKVLVRHLGRLRTGANRHCRRGPFDALAQRLRSEARRRIAHSHTEYSDHGESINEFAVLPERPSGWDQHRGHDLGFLAGYRPTATPVTSMHSEFDVLTDAAGSVHTSDLDDLRPRATQISDDSVAVITSSFDEAVTAQGKVTARGVDYVLRETSV